MRPPPCWSGSSPRNGAGLAFRLTSVSALLTPPISRSRLEPIQGTPGESRGRKATGPRLLRDAAFRIDATKDPQDRRAARSQLGGRVFSRRLVALCTAGIGVEFGFQYDRIPANEMESILAAFPGWG